MGKSGANTVVGSLIVAGALCCAATAAHAASLTASMAQGTAGSQVTFSVTLSTAGAMVAGTENDIAFDATNTPIGTAASGTGTCSVTTATACVSDTDCPSGETCQRADGPDCTAGSTLTNHQAVFAFVGTGQMRAIVVGVSPPSTSAIPDGTVLYTCKVNIAAGANGTFPLTISNVGLADPLGATVSPATGTNGSIVVGAAGPCIGDKDGSTDISAGEVVFTVNAFAQDDVSLNPAADGNMDGSVEAPEVVQVILNFAMDTCNPYHP
jgi:hypothetical protein